MATRETVPVDAEFVDSDAIVKHVEIPGALTVAREPAIVLAEARKAAVALKEVIESKPDKVVLNGKTYLTYEDWQTVARFYGISAKVVNTTYVEYGDVKGFEARAVALLVSNGLEISAADAMCLNDEENWGMRKRYEWIDVLDGKGNLIWEFNKKKNKKLPKREKKLIGEEATPLFQLRSMAQTRACAKALRNVLAFVPVLAGYAPTPAEEMTQRGSQEAADAVAERKLAEYQEAGKTSPNAKAGQSSVVKGYVFIIGYPDSHEGDVVVTAPPEIITKLGLKRKPEFTVEGEENHRLIGFGKLPEFRDLCAERGVEVKDLTVKGSVNA